MIDNLEGFRNYRSPFAGTYGHSSAGMYGYSSAGMHDAHREWVIRRDLYEASGSPARLAEMLTFVTLNNPPFADSDEATDNRHWTGQDATAVIGAVAVALIVAGVFGGFQAAAGVLVVLFVLSAVAWIVH